MNLPSWAIDAGERAGKTFAQAFLAVVGVSSGVSDFSSVQWIHAAEVGAVAVVLSFLTSLASLKIGNSGTASLTNAVEPSKPTPKAAAPREVDAPKRRPRNRPKPPAA